MNCLSNVLLSILCATSIYAHTQSVTPAQANHVLSAPLARAEHASKKAAMCDKHAEALINALAACKDASKERALLIETVETLLKALGYRDATIEALCDHIADSNNSIRTTIQGEL